MDEILRVEGLKKHFAAKKGLLGRRPSGPSVTRAADGVSFSLGRGETFVLAGESGSGKSTIAKIILGSVRPDSGRIFFEGTEAAYGQKSMDAVRAGCQMIQQDPYDSINPRMRVSDVVAEPLEILGGAYSSGAERAARVTEVLREVRLEPAGEIASKYPHMLSGGQRQRVVLARALSTSPRVIIADEPVSMLDVSIRAEMLELMREVQSRHGISFIYITHDLATARNFGHRIGILYQGAIVETGAIDGVLLSPRHPYTQALTDAISEPDPRNLHERKSIRIVTESHDGRQAAGGRDGCIGPSELNTSISGGCRFAQRCPYVADVCRSEPALEEKKPGQWAACHVELGGVSTASALSPAT